MKNLLNCHCVGLHSFPISMEDGLYRRVFYADENHNLWRHIELAVHPHHVDIKIKVLEGVLFNDLYKEVQYWVNGDAFGRFKWSSHIKSGKGGFQYTGDFAYLKHIMRDGIERGETRTMKACELHTVFVEKGKKCVWLIEESVPTCEYFPINYSPHDLEKWTPDGLYIEVDNAVRDSYIGHLLYKI